MFGQRHDFAERHPLAPGLGDEPGAQAVRRPVAGHAGEAGAPLHDARDLIRGQRGAPDATAPEQAAEEGAVLQLRRRQPGLQGDHGVALERLARATTTELQPHCQALQTTVDLTAFEPGDLPDWLKDAEIEAFYLRAIGERIVPAPQGLQ